MARGQRAKILEHSARLFSRQGVAATTIREIAESVGLNSGTLYHYFASKDEIASEILLGFLEELSGEYQGVSPHGGTARDNLRELIRISFQVAVRHPYATEIYQNEYGGGLPSLPRYDEIMELVERCHEAWNRVIEHGVAREELRRDIDSHNFQRILREVVFMAVRWNRETLAGEVDSLAGTLTSAFIDGFGARPGERGTAPSAPVPVPAPPEAAPAPGNAELARLNTELNELKRTVEMIRRGGR
ncbi:helix-turn-helix domain-containing protein [Spirillospora sp. NPDC029432]|uniref:TetR/AcrR family transcriptional regulator n=1 Tax=Spirillospora sp. NPDC029432 TaxID=3154599 RepID=UPI003456746D